MLTASDLTIIIPTLGRDESMLAQIIGALCTKPVKVVVVWDANAPPDDRFQQVFSRFLGCMELVTHPHNLGLSAARNSGIVAIKTKLGMFIDDDIIPANDLVEHVLAFHNEHLSPQKMMLGCVTWRGGPFQNALTDWYETRSNWSLFHTVPAGAPFPYFAGGFTSFKKTAFERLRFDESFVRYGCEDTEFGYRFFAHGGSLSYRPEALGIHMKPLDLASYRRDHTGAGYSHGNLLDIHPDVGLDIPYIIRAITSLISDESLDKLYVVAEELLAKIAEPAKDEQTDLLLRSITTHSIQQGLVTYLCEHHAGFAEARHAALSGKPWPRNVLLERAIDYAPFKLALAQETNDRQSQLHYLGEASALCKHYAAPYIFAFDQALPDRNTAYNALANFLDAQEAHLDNQTRRDIRRRLGAVEIQTSYDDLSARDLYFILMQAPKSRDETIQLSQAILSKEVAHVGARIAWARAVADTDPGLMQILLLEARHFLNSRPLREKSDRDIEISALMSGDIGKSIKQGKS